MEQLINNVQGISSEEGVAEENTEAEEAPQEITPLQELYDLISMHEGAPDMFQLEQWKELYDKFFASSINGEDVFVWKTLKRLEYKSIAASGAMEKQDMLELAVVKKCLLYPIGNSQLFAGLDAGIAPTLFKQIMYQSGFVSDEEAIAMIRRV